MKKSRIVSYTSEELKQLPSESDWEASAAMTDEEIEAAIASDPDENKRSPDWLKRARGVRPAPRYVMSINNKGYQARLMLRRVYRLIPDAQAAQHKLIKIVDDTGENGIFPATSFVPVELSIEAEQNFDLAMV